MVKIKFDSNKIFLFKKENLVSLKLGSFKTHDNIKVSGKFLRFLLEENSPKFEEPQPTAIKSLNDLRNLRKKHHFDRWTFDFETNLKQNFSERARQLFVMNVMSNQNSTHFHYDFIIK